jgi:hypothetical protein
VTQPTKAGPFGADDGGACGCCHLAGDVVNELSSPRTKLFRGNPRSGLAVSHDVSFTLIFLLRASFEVGFVLVVGDDLWSSIYEGAR